MRKIIIARIAPVSSIHHPTVTEPSQGWQGILLAVHQRTQCIICLLQTIILQLGLHFCAVVDLRLAHGVYSTLCVAHPLDAHGGQQAR